MLETLALSLNITRRNWLVYRKDLIANLSPTVADPALLLIALGLGLGAFVSEIEGMTFTRFLAPGLVAATSLFTSFFETSYGFYVRMTFENVFKGMLTTPIGVREVVLGEFIWVGLKGAIMAIGVGIVLAVVGLMSNPLLLPLVAIVGTLVALPCGAMGLLATRFVRNINQFQTVYSFVIAPLYFLSGIFFPIAQMPTVIRVVAEFFPLIHGVRMLQAIFWNREIVEAFAYSGSILVVQTIILCTLAYFGIRKKLIS